MDYRRAVALKDTTSWNQIAALSLLVPKITRDPVAVYGILSSINWSSMKSPMVVPFCRGLPAILINSGTIWELQSIVFPRESFNKVNAFINNAISVFASTGNPDKWVGIHELCEDNGGIAIYQRIDNVKFNEILQDDPSTRDKLKLIWQPRAMCQDYHQLLTHIANRLQSILTDLNPYDIIRLMNDIKRVQNDPELIGDDPTSSARPIQDVLAPRAQPTRDEPTSSVEPTQDLILNFRRMINDLMQHEPTSISRQIIRQSLNEIYDQYAEFGITDDALDIINLLLQQKMIDTNEYEWLLTLFQFDVTESEYLQISQQRSSQSHASTSRSARRMTDVYQPFADQPEVRETRHVSVEPEPYYEPSDVFVPTQSISVNSSDEEIVAHISQLTQSDIPIEIIQAIRQGQINEAYNYGIDDILRNMGFLIP